MPPFVTIPVYVLHVGAGMTGLVSGTIALFARKGGHLHRRAGTVFVAAMLLMAISAAVLAVVMPDQLVNLFIATFTLYLLWTGWLTVRRTALTAGLMEKIQFLLAVGLCAPFAILSFQLATGLTPLFRSTVAFKGPVLIAIYSFTAVLLLAALGDAKLVFLGGVTGPARLTRHLWRMCIGLSLAAGSAFTNGFARLLPGPYHVPPSFFYPQLLPLAFLVFWMIRVRLAARSKTHGTVLRDIASP
jgi:uncharacterized membrane protein